MHGDEFTLTMSNGADMSKRSKSKRKCFFIPIDGFVDGEGFRVSVVTEDEPGHCPTGVWPQDGTEVRPYFWGKTFEEATAICEQQNERFFGLSPKDVAEIVASSMAAGDPR